MLFRSSVYFGYIINGGEDLCIDECRGCTRLLLVEAATMLRLVASLWCGLGRVVLVLGLNETRQDSVTSVLQAQMIIVR